MSLCIEMVVRVADARQRIQDISGDYSAQVINIVAQSQSFCNEYLYFDCLGKDVPVTMSSFCSKGHRVINWSVLCFF